MRLPNFLIVYLILLLSTHAFAMGFSFYYSFWWFDILMHFAGGIWLGVVGYYFLFSSRSSQKFLFPLWFGFWAVVMIALFVGVMWEFFEFLIDSFGILYIDEKNPRILLEDTLLDLLMDMVGALASAGTLLVFKKCKIPQIIAGTKV